MKRPGAPPVAFSPSMIQRAAVRTVAFDRSLEYSEDVDFLLSILLVHPFVILPDITYAYTEVRQRLAEQDRRHAEVLPQGFQKVP